MPEYADSHVICDNDYNEITKVMEHIGVFTGWEPTASSPTAMTVEIAAGTGYVADSAKVTGSSTTKTIEAAHATKHRRDIIIYDTSESALAVVKGTAEAILPHGETDFKKMTHPKPPDLPASTDILIAQIYVAAGTSSITTADIWDKRFMLVSAKYHHDQNDPEGGVDALDCAAAGEIVGVAAAAEGSAHSFARSDHTHQIQHSIANNHIVKDCQVPFRQRRPLEPKVSRRMHFFNWWPIV